MSDAFCGNDRPDPKVEEEKRKMDISGISMAQRLEVIMSRTDGRVLQRFFDDIPLDVMSWKQKYLALLEASKSGSRDPFGGPRTTDLCIKQIPLPVEVIVERLLNVVDLHFRIDASEFVRRAIKNDPTWSIHKKVDGWVRDHAWNEKMRREYRQRQTHNNPNPF